MGETFAASSAAVPAGAPPALQLPARDPGDRTAGTGAPATYLWSGDELERLAGSTGVRVPDVLHAAFTLLVHRYSGQDDFASARAGGTSSGRPVAVRSRIAEDETLAAMAAELGARYRRAAAEAGPDETAGLGTGLRVGHVESDGSAGLPEGFALLLHSERTPDGHRFTLHHDTGLLADELVARMAANLVTLLRDAVRRPETPATRCPKSCTTRWPSRCRPPSTSGSRSASRSPRTSATTTCPN